MKVLKIVSSATILFLLLFCASSQEEANQNKMSFKELALQRFGTGSECTTNPTDDFALCLTQTKPTAQFPQNHLRFFVYDIQKKEIIFEDSLDDGKVEWLNPYQIRVTITPGILTIDPEINRVLTGYIYDIKSKQKITEPESGDIEN